MSSPRPVIIDTDPGVDDALALLLAAASPEIEVLAVTTVAGNIGLERTTDNARRILPVAWGDRTPPPIFRGRSGAEETAEQVHGADGLGGVTGLLERPGRPLYPPAAPVACGDAVGEIMRLARSRPGEITLVTLGPLTNVAEAVRRDAEGLRLLREVVVMGGAFREAGNVTPVAEFNAYADPESAWAVSAAGLPLRWVPLDVTHRCLLREEHFAGMPDTRRVRFARQVVRHYMQHEALALGSGACYLHDPLAVGAVVWPELLTTSRLDVDVETDGRLTRGMTIADFRARHPAAAPHATMLVSLDVDAPEFVKRFLRRLP